MAHVINAGPVECTRDFIAGLTALCQVPEWFAADAAGITRQRATHGNMRGRESKPHSGEGEAMTEILGAPSVRGSTRTCYGHAHCIWPKASSSHYSADPPNR